MFRLIARALLAVSAALLLPSITLAQTAMPTIAFGNKHAVALRDNGDVLTWGDNLYCQLGRGTSGRTAATPTLVLRNIKEIAVASDHAFALASDGTVFGWGGNGEGVLGTGDEYDKCEGPTRIESLAGKQVVHVATGYYFSMAVTANGDLYCSGDNSMSQCPVGPAGKVFSVNRFTQVPFSELAGTVSEVRTGSFHTLVLTRSGRLYAFGRGNDGQLGGGPTSKGLVAIALNGVVSFSAGTWHSVASLADGSAWSWGADNYSQLCDGRTTSRAVPARIDLPEGTAIEAAAAGGHSTMLRARDGRVFACGDNRRGQLGLGQETSITAPQLIAPQTVKLAFPGGALGAVSPDGCVVSITGAGEVGVVGAGSSSADVRAFTPRAGLSLCAPARADASAPLPTVVHEAPHGGESGCWTPRNEEDASTNAKFAGLRQAMLAAEALLRNNAAWMAAPEPVRMRTSLSIGPYEGSGGRMHVKAVAERKRDGTRVWRSGCTVIPQVDRIGGQIAQVSIFFNTSSPFLSATGTPPVLTGRVAGFPEYNGWILIAKDNRVPWIPVTLAEMLDAEGEKRARAVEDWKQSRARMKAPDPAWMQQTYEMLKKSDPAGAEKFLVSMNDQTAQFPKRLAEFDAQGQSLEQRVTEYKQYRASFTPEQLEMAAVLADSKPGESLTNLRPGDRAHAIRVKADPAFPSAAETNRIQFIAVYFTPEPDPARTDRQAWREKVIQTFDFATVAALVR